MALYTAGSEWFMILAFVVVSGVVTFEILKRRADKRRGSNEAEDRPDR